MQVSKAYVTCNACNALYVPQLLPTTVMCAMSKEQCPCLGKEDASYAPHAPYNSYAPRTATPYAPRTT